MERVFGVARLDIEAAWGRRSGFQPIDLPLVDVAARLEERGEFRPRDAVEDDPSWLQIIPYVMLTCRGSVLLLERLATQGERRLHHRLSIGVGGHLNPEPPGAEPLLVRGLRRELCEEIALPPSSAGAPELLGFIRDDSDAVGRVHFGVACRLELAEPAEVRETDRMRGLWVDGARIDGESARLEGWSRILWSAVRIPPRRTTLQPAGDRPDDSDTTARRPRLTPPEARG
jgi:predicted NUDIX family phosphoesterase